MTAEGTPTDTIAWLLAVSNETEWDFHPGGADDNDPYYRDARAILSPEHLPSVADALAATDPQAVLDALTRAGVLHHSGRALRSCGCRAGANALMCCDMDGPVKVETRLLTEWREVQS